MSKKVFIGVGHGGSDPGANVLITEKEYTQKTTFALAEILSEYCMDYKMSRIQDIDTDMNYSQIILMKKLRKLCQAVELKQSLM